MISLFFVFPRFCYIYYYYFLPLDSNKINISFIQDDPCTSKRDSIDRSSIDSNISSIEKNILRGVEVKEEGLFYISYIYLKNTYLSPFLLL